MSRKDPISGCMVMTMPEFLTAEAEREGKGRCGGDILADIFSEIDDDTKRCEDELRKPENALEAIKLALKEAEEYWEDEYGEGTEVPRVVEVIKILAARVSQTFSASAQRLLAEVRTNDGKLCYVEHSYSHWSGTRMDPPEEDSTLYFGEFRPMSEHPWKCFRCYKVRETGARNWTHIKQSDDSTKAVHLCPHCNGYVAEKRAKAAERGRRRMERAKAKKFGWKL